MSRVAFVTGAGGFLGGAAASALQAAGWRVAAIGHPSRHPEDTKGLIRPAASIEGEVTLERLGQAAEALGQPELIFHAAGGASVGASLADPDADRARTVASVTQTLTFLKAQAPRARLIYPSSAAVYGASASGPIDETAQLDPISPYGVHKAAAEGLIAQACADFGLDAVIIRFFSIYGPGLRKQLLWELANRLAAAPAQIQLAGRGDEARDFLHVDDAVALVELAASLRPLAEPMIVNGAAGRAVSVREIAESLARAMGVQTHVAFNGVVREGDPKSLVADAAKAQALGFSPKVSLQAGLERLAGWFKSVKA